jgi:chromate transport protein ChrA
MYFRGLELKLSLWVLSASWALALVARVALFREGDTVGAYACTVIFAIATAGLVGIAVWRLVADPRGERLKYGLILGALLAFVSRTLMEDGPAASAAVMVFLLCALGLLFVLIRDAWDRSKQNPDPETL